jgi:hypothetical protein
LDRMQPLAGVRGVAREVLDRRWGDLGARQGSEVRGSAPASGWVDGGPAGDGCGEVGDGF